MESTCRDFWKMVHERQCGAIVMLSRLSEDGKVGELGLHADSLVFSATSNLQSNCDRVLLAAISSSTSNSMTGTAMLSPRLRNFELLLCFCISDGLYTEWVGNILCNRVPLFSNSCT